MTLGLRPLTALKWIGTATQVAGVFAMASHLVWPPLCYGVMLVGSSAWAAAAWAMGERSMLALNGAFTLSNVIGLWRWWAAP